MHIPDYHPSQNHPPRADYCEPTWAMGYSPATGVHTLLGIEYRSMNDQHLTFDLAVYFPDSRSRTGYQERVWGIYRSLAVAGLSREAQLDNVGFSPHNGGRPGRYGDTFVDVSLESGADELVLELHIPTLYDFLVATIRSKEQKEEALRRMTDQALTRLGLQP